MLQLARVIANLDRLVVTLWTHGCPIEIAVFPPAASLTLGRLRGLRSHRTLLPWLGVVILVASYFTGVPHAVAASRRHAA